MIIKEIKAHMLFLNTFPKHTNLWDLDCWLLEPFNRKG